MIHPPKQDESQNQASWESEGFNLEGSVRSAGVTPMLLHGYRADLIEAGLNEPAGRVLHYGDCGSGVGLA